jgi:hypothetical protein
MTGCDVKVRNNCFLLSRKKFIVNNYTLTSFEAKTSLNSTRMTHEDNCLLGCCDLTMEEVSTSETSDNFCETTWRNISEDSHLYTRRRQNLKSHKNTLSKR